jgi:hypothetical protein
VTDFVLVYQEIHQLGRDMVRLEAWAAEAAARRRWMRVGEINEERDQARERRSQLMREVWEPRRRRSPGGTVSEVVEPRNAALRAC